MLLRKRWGVAEDSEGRGGRSGTEPVTCASRLAHWYRPCPGQGRYAGCSEGGNAPPLSLPPLLLYTRREFGDILVANDRGQEDGARCGGPGGAIY